MTLPLTRPCEYDATRKAFQKTWPSTRLLAQDLGHIILAKYDGVCGLAVFEGGKTPRMLSRTGEDYPVSCSAILARLKYTLGAWNGARVMLAGEVWRPGCAQPKISGDFRQQRDVIYDFQFRLFDMVYLDEPFNLQPYHVRLDRYRALAHADTGVAPGDATEISYAKPVMLRAGQTPEELAREMGDGYDGVVVWDLHSIPVWDEKARMGQAIKFKPNITVDVRCTGGIQGEGKHAGRLGALTYTTADGKTGSVGTGFSDEQRKTFWDALRLGLGVAGDIFEVEAMGRTPDGNLREPRFKGFRFDKTESD